MPYHLLSDQGPEFGSELFLEICQTMGIDKIRTSPYRSACNGMHERYHRTLNFMLGKIVEENQRDWNTKVQFVMAAYRASVHGTTGYMANFLALGREGRASLDIILGQPKKESQHWESHVDFVADQQKRMRCAYAAVRENLRRCAERRKKTYDLHVRKQDTEVGTWVWYYYPRKWTGR